MKKIIVFICFFAGVSVLYSQEYQYTPFPTENVVWSESYYSGGEYGTLTYERFTLNGEDTVINEITYKKLYMFFDTVFNKSDAVCVGGIREDENKRIYYQIIEIVHFDKPTFLYSPDEEVLLYDFSLSVGDTAKITSGEILIVTSIDTITIGNSERKRFHLSYPSGFSTRAQWVEGIGNLEKGLLFTSGAYPFSVGSTLYCFKENDEILYLNEEYSDCYPDFANIQEYQKEEYSISVYPNPAKEKIIFRFSENGIKQIKIYDSKGALIDTIEVSDNLLEVEYKTSHYKAGVYLYSILNNKNQETKGNFIVL